MVFIEAVAVIIGRGHVGRQRMEPWHLSKPRQWRIKTEAAVAIRWWSHCIHESHGDQQWSEKPQSPSDDGAMVFVEAMDDQRWNKPRGQTYDGAMTFVKAMLMGK